MRTLSVQSPVPISGRLPGTLGYIVAIGWFTGVIYLGATGFFRRPSPFPLTYLQLAIFIPMLLFWALYAAVKPFRTYILSLDFLFLNALQCWRVLGGAILIIWGYGLLPGGFAIPMSILDMSVGIIAVYVVYAIAHQRPNWRTSALWMNSWGFLDFFVTIGLALFAGPLAIDPPAPGGVMASLVEVPLSAFPSFAIPFFSCLHFAALAQLYHTRHAKADTAAT